MDPTQRGPGAAKILLVDDTPANLDLLCEVLENEDYRLFLAPDGESALRITAKVIPDLILLDVKMPGISGFEVCARLKKDPATQSIPVIFITAEDRTENVVEGFDAGGIDYITKPFQAKEVLVRVRTHLEMDWLRKELTSANQWMTEISDRKSRFLANIAHELRTPMNAIIGFTRMVLDKEGDRLSEQQRGNLTNVTSSSDHLLNLINDLLDLSKIEAGRMDVTVEPFDLDELIASCCDEISPLIVDGVDLQRDVSADLADLQTDVTKLRQILTNLLSNAAKFTTEGSIGVRAVREGESVAISVTDTGKGIPEEAQAIIFEEFRQVKGTDARTKGTGLGLPISVGYARLLGGSIDLVSAEGDGSTFTLRVPLVLAPQPAEDPAPSHSPEVVR